MSDYSTQAIGPKERRTCRTCKNVNAVWLDCFHAANDSSYYMRCTRPDMRACERYVDDPDSLPRRHERLAQVAREMLRYARIRLQEHWTEEDAMAVSAYREELERLGVSVDDM